MISPGHQPLTNDTKALIRQRLKANVPVPTIVTEFDLPDSDMIYDAQEGELVRNRDAIAEEKWRWSVAAAGQRLARDELIPRIRAIRNERGPLRILDLGCGVGSLANDIAAAFPDCTIKGVDLSAANVDRCRRRYDRPNLSFEQVDAAQLEASGEFDIAVSVNVLEHVDDIDGYLNAAFRALNDRGRVLLSFPVVRYWSFWGWPRWLVCRLLRKPYLTHARDPKLVRESIGRSSAVSADELYHGLFLPRRTYYYLAPALLSAVGHGLKAADDHLAKAGITFPFMFAFLDVMKRGGVLKKAPPARSMPNALIGIIILLPLWMLSNLLLAIDVVAGRRTFFTQC